LQLQPTTLSYFFLALAMWFLRPAGGAALPAAPLFRWPLLVLFAVWANMDGWFVLGLALVAVVALGRILDQQASAVRLVMLLRSVGSLVLLTAVCLLNPSHVYAFTLLFLPSSLIPHPFSVASPFQKTHLANLMLTPAGLAYYPLLGLGVVSFVLNLPRWHWQRFLPWCGLAALSILQVRTIPFFAVAAGPIAAWNLHDFFALRSESERRQGVHWGQAQLSLRVVVAVLGVLFLASAWPGWLQEPPFEPRRLAIEPPPSLMIGAEAVQSWHDSRRLEPQMRGLHLSPESAAAFAWFCPEDRGLFDNGLAAAIRGDSEETVDWAEHMRSEGLNHVVVYDPRRERLLAALHRFLSDPHQWPLLWLEGDLAVFGWRDSLRSGNNPAAKRTKDPFQGWGLDLDRLAFDPARVKPAPRIVADTPSDSRRWWDAFWRAAPPRSVDTSEATLYLLYAETLRQSAPYRHLSAWEAIQSASMFGVGANCSAPAGLLDADVRLVLIRPPLGQPGDTVPILFPLSQLALSWQRGFTLQRDDVPPALLYLAIRAARRAVAANPEDAQAYLVLGQCYLRLVHDTRERAWGVQLPELVQLRRVQASTALNQAILLKPKLAQAHLHLGYLYHEMGCLDLALKHFGTHLQLLREAGAPPQGSVAQFREQEAQYEQGVRQLAALVEDRENAYAAESSRLRVLDRALLAVKKGLASKARDLLLETDVALFGAQGMELELELLLRTGQAKDVCVWTDAANGTAPLEASNRSLRIQALAALGDYAAAQEECAQVVAGQGQDPRFREVIAQLAGRAVLDESPGPGFLPALVWKILPRINFGTSVYGLVQSMRHSADMSMLRGLLRLEEGNLEEAEVFLRLTLFFSLEEWKGSSGGLGFISSAVARECLEWLRQE
jgi:tetratricopeptide (TPR) repeat protein